MYRSKERWIIQSAVSVGGVTPSLMQVVRKAALPVELNTQEISLPKNASAPVSSGRSAPSSASSCLRNTRRLVSEWVSWQHGPYYEKAPKADSQALVDRCYCWMDTPGGSQPTCQTFGPLKIISIIFTLLSDGLLLPRWQIRKAARVFVSVLMRAQIGVGHKSLGLCLLTFAS